jgi:8-oxo-dGTP diphosphatase
VDGVTSDSGPAAGRAPGSPARPAIDLAVTVLPGSGPSPARPPDGEAAEPGLPAIPVSAGALIFDRKGRLLILKPTYKSGWTIPGGVMEADGESPWQACRREVLEETAIDVTAGRLAGLDFRRPKPGNPGGIRYLFDCGVIDDARLAAIVVQPEEIAEYRLAALPDALELLRRPIRRRVRAAIRGRGLVYLENGRPVGGVA